MISKHSLQAIFFDFDGVLVDSNTTKTEAFRTLFRDYNDEIILKIVAHHQRHGGISRVEKIRYAYQHIIKQPLTDEKLASLAEEYSDLVVEKVINIDWIAGAKEFLEGIQEALPVFVISGTPEDELKEIIERRKMSRHFKAVLGSPIKKPVHICNLLFEYRLSPENCVFVGDALTDYYAARETGLHFIGIQGDVKFPKGTTVLSNCKRLKRVFATLFTC